MLKKGDLVKIEDFGQSCICKVVNPGSSETKIRVISVEMIWPLLGKEAYKILVDIDRVKKYNTEEQNLLKALYM